MIVLSQIPKEPYNSLWHLFSAVPEAVQFGVQHYQPHTAISAAYSQLFENYEIEGLTMPYTMEDLEREVARKRLKDLTVDERIEGLSADELLGRFSADELLAHFSAEELLRLFSTEELLRHLSVDQIRTYLERLEQQENGQSETSGED